MSLVYFIICYKNKLFLHLGKVNVIFRPYSMEFLNMTCFIMHFYDFYTFIYFHAKYDISIYKTHTYIY